MLNTKEMLYQNVGKRCIAKMLKCIPHILNSATNIFILHQRESKI